MSKRMPLFAPRVYTTSHTTCAIRSPLLLQNDKDLGPYKNQAKVLFKRLNDSSPARCTIETGPMCF